MNSLNYNTINNTMNNTINIIYYFLVEAFENRPILERYVPMSLDLSLLLPNKHPDKLICICYHST